MTSNNFGPSTKVAINGTRSVGCGRIPSLVQYATLCPKAREKESFAEAYPPRLLLHHIALSGEHAGKPQQREGTEEEGGRRLFLSPPNHFTHPRFSNCLTLPLALSLRLLFSGRSVALIHPSIHTTPLRSAAVPVRGGSVDRPLFAQV